MSEDNVSQETKFLTKAWLAFLREYLLENKENPLAHHPPPAFTHIYGLVLKGLLQPAEHIDTVDIVKVLDMVVKFTNYLHDHKIDYRSFTPCKCSEITDEDLAIIIENWRQSSLNFYPFDVRDFRELGKVVM